MRNLTFSIAVAALALVGVANGVPMQAANAAEASGSLVQVYDGPQPDCGDWRGGTHDCE